VIASWRHRGTCRPRRPPALRVIGIAHRRGPRRDPHQPVLRIVAIAHRPVRGQVAVRIIAQARRAHRAILVQRVRGVGGARLQRRHSLIRRIVQQPPRQPALAVVEVAQADRRAAGEAVRQRLHQPIRPPAPIGARSVAAQQRETPRGGVVAVERQPRARCARALMDRRHPAQRVIHIARLQRAAINQDEVPGPFAERPTI
jgi:hypothetical protein